MEKETVLAYGKHKYRCKLCWKEVVRESDKEWINSYCEQTGKTTRIRRVKPT